MNLEQYIAFTPSTAIYTKKNELQYLTLGLISEVGELSGKVAKLFRGDKTIEGMREKIAQEVGDIFWFLSQLHHLSDTIDLTQNVERFETTPEDLEWLKDISKEETLDGLYSLCKDLQLEAWHFLTDERVFEIDANEYIQELYLYSISVLALIGFEKEEVFDMNYEKLTGRKAAGTLKGDGDGVNDRH